MDRAISVNRLILYRLTVFLSRPYYVAADFDRVLSATVEKAHRFCRVG